MSEDEKKGSLGKIFKRSNKKCDSSIKRIDLNSIRDITDPSKSMMRIQDQFHQVV